jgi:hypothetical protein
MVLLACPLAAIELVGKRTKSAGVLILYCTVLAAFDLQLLGCDYYT